ncbi:MAG TPA: hypothetical protein VEI83_06025 [Acidimicrobiales bacterium]|nr:hypothetical protein [Acidimicrobiales bacterium]
MVGALAVTGLVLGACTSSGSGSSSSSSTSSSSSSSSSAGGSSLSSEIQALSSKIQSGKGATFKATYTSTGGSSSSQTIVFEQKPPKTFFSSGTGEMINDGTTTYFCDTSNTPPTCISSSTSSNPLASLIGIFSGATVTAFLQTAQAQAAAHAAGYNLSYSDGTFAGQPSKCISATGPQGSGKYCVTDSGIIAYVDSGNGNVFQLTDYTTNVSDSDFTLPAGATTQTLPSGVSIPSVP